MLLHKENDAPNGILLRFFRYAKRISVHVNVQAASACVVREVIERQRLFHNLAPFHFVQVIIERHRVADYLKAIVKTAVVLAIDSLAVRIGDVEQGFRAAVGFAATIYLKLNAHKKIARTVKYRLGLVVV